MIEIEIKIELPELWGTHLFSKNEWGSINLLVGANGTGKSLFAEKLKAQINKRGFSVRMLNAERLSGFEKQGYSYFTNDQLRQGLNISHFKDYKSFGEDFGLSTSAFVILKERLDIKLQIEAFLSDIFKKNIRLEEEGGFLKPKIQNIKGGVEYSLKEKECHGLKELITLLTFLYDDSKECLILDEPELHLHPQFQSFFLEEVRKLSGNPKEEQGKKIFFLITHSPYFIDLRTIEDLKSVVVFQSGTPPAYLDSIDSQDEYVIKKFLPRFNTHHKQFFFSKNPVFVEGYTDQQLITLIYDKIEKDVGSAGSCIIDVGGKDELAVFFRLCNKLDITPIIIADLDALFRGKLRECLCNNDKSNLYVQNNGIGESLSAEIGDLETKLKIIAEDLIAKNSDDIDINHLIEKLKTYIVDGQIENMEQFRFSMLLGLLRFKEKLEMGVSKDKRPVVNLIAGRVEHILNSARECNIHFIPIGELEHYYTQSSIDYLNITNKDVAFHTERDFILEADKSTIASHYSLLISNLENVIPTLNVDLLAHLKYELIEWSQKLQTSVVRGEVKNIDQLKENARVNYELYKQIIEIIDFNINEPDNTFKCKIKLVNKLADSQIELEIDENTTAHNFTLE